MSDPLSTKSDTLYLDPWTERWVTLDQLIVFNAARIANSQTLRYRVRRLWERARFGWWLPNTQDLLARHDFIGGL